MDYKTLYDNFWRYYSEYGRVPGKNSLKATDGFISSYQYTKFYNNKKWNEIVILMGATPNNTMWAEEELICLQVNWEKYDDEQLSKELNKTIDSIRYKRNELGLHRASKKQKWERWEIDYLKENFAFTPEDEIAEKLSHRKYSTIRAYATKTLKIKRYNHLHKFKLEGEKRICKDCNKILPENDQFFYRDRNGFRTRCKECWDLNVEMKSRKNGKVTIRLKNELLIQGAAYCSSCKDWLETSKFRTNFNDVENIHRYCEECERKYLREYHLKKRLGPNYSEDDYYDNLIVDSEGNRCDSIPEMIISNWFISKGIQYISHPLYRDYFDKDQTRRRLDWVVSYNGREYYIEYFGLWSSQQLNNPFIYKYIKKAKKKISNLSSWGYIDNCIFIFPGDLENKTLDEIFKQII